MSLQSGTRLGPYAILALAIGLGIGYVDSLPTWDDTGITVGALVISAGLLAILRPRIWWVTGLLIGAPVPLFNFLRTGGWQATAALAFALLAAGIGGLVGRLVSR